MLTQVSADSARVILDSVFSQPAYQWVDRPDALSWLRHWWDLLLTWLYSLQLSNPTAFLLVQYVLVAILGAVFLHAGWVMLRTVRAASRREESARGMLAVERRGPRSYVEVADGLASEGRYTEAVQALFSALVLELGERGILRYHPSKTPYEYVQELEPSTPSRERFAGLVTKLYGYVFARRPCDAEEYRQWREQAGREWHAPAR